MQRRRTIFILALAWCLFSTTRPAMAQQTSATFSMELRVTSPTMRNTPGMMLIVRIGTYESRTSIIGAWHLSGLTRYFHSWHDTAIEILTKSSHIA